MSFLKYYRVCAVCQLGSGSLSWHPIEWLCPSCYQHFLKETRIIAYKTSIYKDPVYCLTLWRKENQEFISKLAQSLKGNHNYLGWLTVTKILVRELVLNNLLYWKEAEVIVPAPCHSRHRQHAQVFAQILGQQLNLPVDLNLLSFTKQKRWFHFNRIQNDKQALRSKKQRAKIQLIAKKHKYKKILFVDDICTTGSTISVARQVLGSLSYFQPFVLTCRAKESL